jgi:hypothetical protein
MTGDARVSFRDAAGKELTADLALVRADQLLAGRPWRVFRWRQGQARYSGWYWSAAAGGHVAYESRLELARLLLADFDRRVTAIAAQPFLVTAPSGGRVWRHVPDFLLADCDGGVCVVNVKPADQLAVSKVAEALAWAGEVFAGGEGTAPRSGAGAQVADDEIAPEGDGRGLGLSMRAGIPDQLLVLRSQQVEEGELAVPGEDLIVPLDVEQGCGGDPPGISCEALRCG